MTYSILIARPGVYVYAMDERRLTPDQVGRHAQPALAGLPAWGICRAWPQPNLTNHSR
jgi:hypothetical protein